MFVFRTWLASGLFLLELAWATEYYRWYSSKDPLYFKIIIAVAIAIDLVGFITKCINIYLVCSS